MEDKETYIKVKLSDLNNWRSLLQELEMPKVLYSKDQLEMANSLVELSKNVSEHLRREIKYAIEGDGYKDEDEEEPLINED